ncbi:hypothetical protein AAW14_30245 [Streptomyces hygroscopicus]|uniref:hypothetical protein n=1 Tax=Streptomyces hygroscopicus TaxID=1912 RepID=UPI003A100AA5|nr:hypothetical protein [Streptomyces hygroscopicus]
MTVLAVHPSGRLALRPRSGLHGYACRPLVRDTTRGPGLARRAGEALLVAGPVLTVAALAAEHAGTPSWLQRILARPGFLVEPASRQT